AVVLDIDHHVVARRGAGAEQARRTRIDRQSPRPHRDLAALRHRIARVDDQIQQGRTELRGIDVARPHVFVEVHRHLDRLPEYPPGQHVELVYQAVQVPRLQTQRLPPREGQKLTRELLAADGGFSNRSR